MPTRRLSIALLIGALLLIGDPAAALSPTDFPQTEANPPVSVPATPSCEVTLMQWDFASSYGKPYGGDYSPPSACPAPWSKVVLTFSASVSGVQYDRLVDAYVGGVLIYSGSTSEPCCTPGLSTPVAGTPGATTRWTVQKDVSEYEPVLAGAHRVEVDLNNVWNSTYTGIYHTRLTLTFYDTGRHAPAAAHPDFVLPYNAAGSSYVDGYLTPDAHGNVPAAPYTFPPNLTELQAELFAQGHGPCEEFWWSEPSGCGTGTPYREVAIYLDGRIAGAAPAYPAVFTGADGPGLWEPIPSPRAWNLTPFTVDLTPFVGTLTDGLPHQVALHLFDIDWTADDYWLIEANLLGWQAAAPGRTTGGLSSTAAPAAPTETGGWDPTGNALYQDRASHTLSFTGWQDTPSGRRVTTVMDSMAATSRETAATLATDWDWKTVTTSTLSPGAGKRARTKVSSSEQRFSIDNEALTRFAFTDSGRSLTATGWSAYDETMTTADATDIAYNGIEREEYAASDSAGLCYDRTLTAAAGEIVADQTGARCPPPPGSG